MKFTVLSNLYSFEVYSLSNPSFQVYSLEVPVSLYPAAILLVTSPPRINFLPSPELHLWIWSSPWQLELPPDAPKMPPDASEKHSDAFKCSPEAFKCLLDASQMPPDASQTSKNHVFPYKNKGF